MIQVKIWKRGVKRSETTEQNALPVDVMPSDPTDVTDCGNNPG
jgi:hypothetical protein